MIYFHLIINFFRFVVAIVVVGQAQARECLFEKLLLSYRGESAPAQDIDAYLEQAQEAAEVKKQTKHNSISFPPREFIYLNYYSSHECVRLVVFWVSFAAGFLFWVGRFPPSAQNSPAVH
jgi:hypothetical protein